MYEPGRLEAQGQTAVQCWQNEDFQQHNSTGAVSTQIGYAPVRLEAQGQKKQFQRRQSDSSQQQNSSRAVSNQINQIGHAPVRLKTATTESREVRVSHVTFDTTHRESEQPSVSKTGRRSSSSVHNKRDIAAAERWRDSLNPNRAYIRSVGSPGPDSRSVQTKRDFAAAEEQ